MPIIALAQFTICDTTDITSSATAPVGPALNQLLKLYLGSMMKLPGQLNSELFSNPSSGSFVSAAGRM